MKQRDQVVAADVEDFVPLFQHGIEVGILDMADPGNGRRHRSRAVRVGVTGHPVLGPAEHKQDRNVNSHWFNQE